VLVKESLIEWNNDNVPRLAAALSFYALLSLSPLLVIVIAIAGAAFGQTAATGELAKDLSVLVGAQAGRAMGDAVHAANASGAGIFATILSVLSLVVGSTGAAVELRESLNTIWRVPRESSRSGLHSVMSLMRERFYSFLLILACGLLLILSIALSASIAAMGSFLGAVLTPAEVRLHLASSLSSFFVFWIVFGVIYKMVPDVRLRWSDVMVGAAVTSLLFTIGKLPIGIYLGKAGFPSTYGAAGSAVIVVVWMYYSAQLFFLGAEFTKVSARIFVPRPAVNTSRPDV
jgi:membrane protein